MSNSLSFTYTRKQEIYVAAFLRPPVCKLKSLIPAISSNITRFHSSSVPSLIFLRVYFTRESKFVCLFGKCRCSSTYARSSSQKAMKFWSFFDAIHLYLLAAGNTSDVQLHAFCLLIHYLLTSTIVLGVPNGKCSQSVPQWSRRPKAEVFFKWCCICECHRNITCLHRNKFLVCFKVII